MSCVEVNADDGLAALEDWQWDGRDLRDIRGQMDMISNHCRRRMRDWVHTVPEAFRGEVFYISSSNPFNSIGEIRSYAEILAVDHAGWALVRQCDFYTYVDVDPESFIVCPLTQAQALIEEYRQRKSEREAAEAEIFSPVP